MGLTSLLVVFVVFICFIGAIKRPIAAVLGYLIVYAVYNANTWYGYQLQAVLYRPSLAAAIVLLLSCVLNYQKLSWKFSRREIEIYLFMVAAFVVSYLFGVGVSEVSSMYLEKLLKISFFIFLFLRTVRTVEDYKTILLPFIGGALFLSWQATQIGGFYDGRLTNIGGADFSNANTLASFLMFSIILLGFKLFKSPWWKKGIIVFAIAFLVNTFILTQSRAVFLGLFFGVIYAVVSSPKKIKGQIIIYTILAIFMFSMLTQEKFWERMGTIEEEAGLVVEDNQTWQTNNAPNRLDFWIASVDIFKDHPLGIGVKNFSTVVQLYDPRNPGMDAHNTYVVCYSEIGIIGIALFLIIIFGAIFQLRRIKKLSQKLADPFEIEMLTLSMTMFLIVYLTGPMLTHGYLYTEFTWILLALPICFERAVKDAVYADNVK